MIRDSPLLKGLLWALRDNLFHRIRKDLLKLKIQIDLFILISLLSLNSSQDNQMPLNHLNCRISHSPQIFNRLKLIKTLTPMRHRSPLIVQIQRVPTADMFNFQMISRSLKNPKRTREDVLEALARNRNRHNLLKIQKILPLRKES